MTDLANMTWIEIRKALRARIPLWTALGSLFMPLAIAMLIFVSKHPEISKKIGLISAKANLVAFAAADWTTYMNFFAQLIAAGGFILFILSVSWIFGREFADGTVKDLLAVPVRRSSILLAKFIVAALWGLGLTVVILSFGLLMGALINLPGASAEIILRGAGVTALTALLTIALALPFALFASLGRGYLLPVGLAVLTLMMTNLVMIAGWGELFPWAVAGLYAEGKTALSAISYWIVILTACAGMVLTYWWWMRADQSR